MRVHKFRTPPMALVATLITDVNARPNGMDSELASTPDSGVYLSVERMAGSESCPDAEAVFRSLTLLFPERSIRRGHDLQTAGTSVEISIRPIAAGHEAQIRTLRPRKGERIITEPDADCRGLSEALAVALVMLNDSQAEGLGEAPDATASTMVTPPLRATPETLMPPTQSTSTAAHASKRHPSVPPSATREKNAQRSSPAPTTPTRAPDVATPNQPKSAVRDSSRDNRTIDDPTVPASATKGIWSTYTRFSALGTYRVLSEPELGMGIGADVFHATGFGVQLAALGMWARSAESLGGSAQIQRLLDAGATAEAIRLLEAGRDSNADSGLAEERDALHIRALIKAQQTAQAAKLAQRFAQRYPNSPQIEAMRRFLKKD